MTVTRLPGSDHATAADLMNKIDHHASAIRDAAKFILAHEGAVEDAFEVAGKRWPNFTAPEFTIMTMIVQAVLEDRVTRGERALSEHAALVKEARATFGEKAAEELRAKLEAQGRAE